MKISNIKRDKIKEQIISVLFRNSPLALFTADIAHEIARDEEFIKVILQEMREQGFISLINMNQNGVLYKRRMRWVLNAQTYEAYKKIHMPQT
jgi:predicted transcriptional regulator with HTH domain